MQVSTVFNAIAVVAAHRVVTYSDITDIRCMQALVNVLLATRSFEAWSTFTRETIDPVHTLASIFTRMTGAFVDVFLTLSSRVSSRTDARVVIRAIFTEATVMAGIRFAVVDIDFTFQTNESNATGANKALKVTLIERLSPERRHGRVREQ